MVRNKVTIWVAFAILMVMVFFTNNSARAETNKSDTKRVDRFYLKGRFGVFYVKPIRNNLNMTCFRGGLGIKNLIFSVGVVSYCNLNENLFGNQDGVTVFYEDWFPIRISFYPYLFYWDHGKSVEGSKLNIHSELFVDALLHPEARIRLFGDDKESVGLDCKIWNIGANVGLNWFSFSIELEAGYIIQTKDWKYVYQSLDQNGDVVETNIWDINISGPYLTIVFCVADLFSEYKHTEYAPVFRKPLFPPILFLNLTFEDANKDNIMEAGETVHIKGRITNRGKGKAVDIKISISSSNTKGIRLPKDINIGDIDPYESKDIDFNIATSDELPDGTNTFTILAIEHFGHNISNKIAVPTEAFRPPRFEVVSTTIDDDQMGESFGNANSMIEPGETIEAVTKIRNSGLGVAKDVNIECQADFPGIMFTSPTKFDLGDMQPGDTREIKYVFIVKKSYAGSDKLPLSIVATESTGRFGLNAGLGLKLNTIAPTKQLVFKPTTQSVDVDMHIPKGKAIHSDALAVIITSFHYRSKDIPQVPFSQHDGAIIKEYFMRTFGIPRENIIQMNNPTKSEWEAMFGTDNDARGKLYSRIIPGKTELFVYYSGHGAPDVESGNSYFVPSDCDPTLVRLGGYPVETFFKNLSLLVTTNTWVIIDACFSGAYQEGTLIPGASPIYINIESSEKLLKNGTVFSSAKGDQIASWYPKKKHGLFTYFFLKGLQGAADKNHDSKITVGEMEQFLADEVKGVPALARHLWRREQEPVVTAVDKDRVLVELK